MDAAILGVLATILAAVIAYVTLVRDRPRLSAVAIAYEDPAGYWCAQITVRNGGRRDITVSHVAAAMPGEPGVVRNFSAEGPVRVPQFGQAVTHVSPDDSIARWNSRDELLRCEFTVVDALGKSYRARFVRTRS